MGEPVSAAGLESDVRETNDTVPSSRADPSHKSYTSDTEAASTAPAFSTTPKATIQDSNAAATAQNASLPQIDTLSTELPRFHIRKPSRQTPRTPLEAGLHITVPTPPPASTQSPTEAKSEGKCSVPHSQPIEIEQGALRSTLSAASMHSVYSLSPGSAISSPAISALPDITPLPSPLATAESPRPWKSRSRPTSSGSLSRSLREEVLIDQTSERASPTRMKKGYGGLTSGLVESGSPGRTVPGRAISEFQPGALHNERPRNVTLATADAMQVDSVLQREKYLAEQRGLTQPVASALGALPSAIPTPPPSNRSVTESEADESRLESSEFIEYLTVRQGPSKRKRKYRPVRPLGQGTFSKVVLATSDKIPPSRRLDETSESWLNPKHLVAIKVVQHGPAGGADADRVDLGLKREIEILRALDHPTLIQLKAFDWSEQEALIVLNYCPGGDLFDLASQHRDLLTPPIVQRMFAELVDAVRYLHSLWIAHRDIKLENVLLNIPVTALDSVEEPFNRPYPLITLTDLGLSRKIPQPPESPLLSTRCGSEDYAAPEILLGQEYDGRQTDAWAIGVLMYALMEGRLPFDPPPVRPGQRPVRSRAAHRIARCDWMWCLYGNEDGEWDPKAGEGWEGARECVEGLLKKVSRGRLSLATIAEKSYVQNAIQVDGGLRRPPHADDEDDQ